jgi:hypothetical protein
MNTKGFNWEYAEKHFNPQHYLWLKMNHKQPFTEEEYVSSMLELKTYSLSPKKQETYKPINLRKNTRDLKRSLDFSPPNPS